jgi:hypothetical protein
VAAKFVDIGAIEVLRKYLAWDEVNSGVDPAANSEQVREWQRVAVFGLNDNGWLGVRENAVEA